MSTTPDLYGDVRIPSRGEPEPDDHGDGGASNGLNPGQAGRPDDNPPRGVDPIETGSRVNQY